MGVYNIICSLRNCVRGAQQTLTLFVWVRILVPQPKKNEAYGFVLFLSNPKDWYVITRSVYVIAVGVWHHRRCISPSD